MKNIRKKIRKKPVSGLRRKAPSKKGPAKKNPLQKKGLEPEQLKVQEAKFSIGKQAIPENAPTKELPSSYGKDRLVILVRDPRWIYAYWELSRKNYGELLGAPKVLRVYDVTQIIFTGANAHKFFDIGISAQADNWYIHTGEPGRSWCVELGVKESDGKFVPLLRSNTVTAPQEEPSALIDEEWVIPEDLFLRLYHMESGPRQSSHSMPSI